MKTLKSVSCVILSVLLLAIGACSRPMVIRELESKATLVVDSEPEGASVHVDGQIVGKTPCTLEIDAGVRERRKVIVAVSKEGYGTKRAEVPLVAGEKLEWTDIRLERELFGELSAISVWVVNINSSTGEVTVNGVDTQEPTIPFTWDWGDGTIHGGWFPQQHTYSDVTKNYIVKVTAHYSGGETDSGEVLVRFGSKER